MNHQKHLWFCFPVDKVYHRDSHERSAKCSDSQSSLKHSLRPKISHPWKQKYKWTSGNPPPPLQRGTDLCFVWNKSREHKLQALIMENNCKMLDTSAPGGRSPSEESSPARTNRNQFFRAAETPPLLRDRLLRFSRGQSWWHPLKAIFRKRLFNSAASTPISPLVQQLEVKCAVKLMLQSSCHLHLKSDFTYQATSIHRWKLQQPCSVLTRYWELCLLEQFPDLRPPWARRSSRFLESAKIPHKQKESNLLNLFSALILCGLSWHKLE